MVRKKIQKQFLFSQLIIFLLLFSTGCDSDEGKVLCTKVIRADLIEVEYNGSLYKTRLIGIKAPPRYHYIPIIQKEGEKTFLYVKALLEGKRVGIGFIKKDEERFKNLCRSKKKSLKSTEWWVFVTLNRSVINELLIKEGRAFASSKYPFDSFKQYKSYEEYAKSDKRGFWVNHINWPYQEEKFSSIGDKDNRIFCSKVISADLIEIDYSGEKYKAQLIGIKPPRRKHLFSFAKKEGERAFKFVKSRIEGKEIEVAFTKVDENKLKGKFLSEKKFLNSTNLHVYVKKSGEIINESLINKGLAYVSSDYPYQLYNTYKEFERIARGKKEGLWEHRIQWHYPKEFLSSIGFYSILDYGSAFFKPKVDFYVSYYYAAKDYLTENALQFAAANTQYNPIYEDQYPKYSKTESKSPFSFILLASGAFLLVLVIAFWRLFPEKFRATIEYIKNINLDFGESNWNPTEFSGSNFHFNNSNKMEDDEFNNPNSITMRYIPGSAAWRKYNNPNDESMRDTFGSAAYNKYNDANDYSMRTTYGSAAWKKYNDQNDYSMRTTYGSAAWKKYNDQNDYSMRYTYGSAAYKKRIEEEGGW